MTQFALGLNMHDLLCWEVYLYLLDRSKRRSAETVRLPDWFLFHFGRSLACVGDQLASMAALQLDQIRSNLRAIIGLASKLERPREGFCWPAVAVIHSSMQLVTSIVVWPLCTQASPVLATSLLISATSQWMLAWPSLDAGACSWPSRGNNPDGRASTHRQTNEALRAPPRPARGSFQRSPVYLLTWPPVHA